LSQREIACGQPGVSFIPPGLVAEAHVKRPQDENEEDNGCYWNRKAIFGREPEGVPLVGHGGSLRDPMVGPFVSGISSFEVALTRFRA